MGCANSLALTVLLAWLPEAIASVSAPPTISVAWSGTTHEAVLPQPFGKIQIHLSTEADLPASLTITVDGQAVSVAQPLIGDLANPEIRSISYSDPMQTESRAVEYFEVLIVFGDEYKVRNEPCDDPNNFTWERDLAAIKVNWNLDVSRELLSFRQMDKCET